ncbi:MAG: 1-deoxy-D-xylulose-5-phosphate reductoisomerase, partial [Pseudomonadota bacterium]
DSEHNAVFQCLPGGQSQAGLIALGVERIILTASGGPFRETPAADLAQVTPEQACAHPNWVMGRKISVDSATLMNKGLEVIEACWLFDLPPERVEVVVHPQSLVHSLVQYRDGSVLAELGYPDMRTPIAHALAWPDRITSGVPPLDLLAAIRCDFQAPDRRRFPCLDLAYGAIRAGGTAPLILNAANEIAVAAFLDHRLGFTQIFQVVDRLLQDTPIEPIESLEQLLAADRRVRQVAHGVVRALA